MSLSTQAEYVIIDRMSRPTHQQVEKLIKHMVLPFCQIERDVPLPIKNRRWENDAEHSWSLALVACSLAPEVDPTLDVGKICQFATVHDLVEIHADDTSVFAKAEHLASKAEREAQALEKFKQDFSFLPWIIQTIEEYERKDTDEARFVYAVDKYIATMFDYIDQGQLFRERQVTLADYNHSMAAHRTKAHAHPVIAKYYDEVRALLDAHPEFFHTEQANA
jgi:putative hydrolase of HD superfamily